MMPVLNIHQLEVLEKLYEQFQDAEDEGRYSDSTDILVEIGDLIVKAMDRAINAPLPSREDEMIELENIVLELLDAGTLAPFEIEETVHQAVHTWRRNHV